MTTEDAMAAVTLLDEIEEIRRLRDKIACEEETCTALEVQIARTRDTLAERRAELVRLRETLIRRLHDAIAREFALCGPGSTPTEAAFTEYRAELERLRKELAWARWQQGERL